MMVNDNIIVEDGIKQTGPTIGVCVRKRERNTERAMATCGFR